MKTFEDGTEEIAFLKGQVFAHQALLKALILTMQPDRLPRLQEEFGKGIEAFRVALLNVAMPERATTALEMVTTDVTEFIEIRMKEMGVRR